MKLKAVKTLRYRTRRLLADGTSEDVRRLEPGDIFETSGKDSRLLLATRKVEKMRDPVDLAPPPPAVAQKIAAAVGPGTQAPSPPAQPPLPATAPPSDMAAARAEYERVSGKKAFNGWDVATLQAKTAAAAKPA